MAKSIWKKQASKLNLSSLYGIAVNGLPVVEELRQKARWNSAQAFLLSFPRGAYTTMLTTQDAHHVMAFERHLLRLASSLQAIRQAQDIAVDTHDYCSVSSLREPVILTVREAISNLERQICGFPSHVLEDYAVCVVVLVPLKGRQLVARASLATRSVASQHVLQAVYFSRKCPQAKDSLWVRERRQLYTSDDNDKQVNELLLVTENNTCLEGSTTNFFVVYHQGFVKTAGSGVLFGIAAQLVEEACKELHIPLLHDAPSLNDLDDWKEVFVTNCVKIVQPVQTIHLPSALHPHRVDFSVSNYIWSWKIRDKVLEWMSQEAYDVFSDSETFGRKRMLWNHLLQLQSSQVSED